LRIAFAGTPEFALPALTALCARHQVVGVLTPPDRRSGRGRQLTASPVKSEALRRALPLLQPASLKDPALRAQLSRWQADAVVVVAYGLLLPPDILALPALGCLNIHASLLPRWRGAAPIERALLTGDEETGVSIMRMDAGLDTGPVLLERRLKISATDTGGSLSRALAVLGAETLLEALDGLADGSLAARPQASEGVTYAAKIDRREALIDWGEGALAIDRKVRAFHPKPIAETVMDGEQLRIFAGRVAIGVDHDGKNTENYKNHTDPGLIIGLQGEGMLIQCGEGRFEALSVQRPGRRAVSGREYGQGRTGQRLG
jgi:methionyl-tRNA formyltransferase